MRTVERDASAAMPEKPWQSTAQRVVAEAQQPTPALYQGLTDIVKTDIKSSPDTQGQSRFISLVLFALYQRLTNRTTRFWLNLPASLHQRLMNQANRILRETAPRPDNSHDLNSDLFHKDLALLAGRLLPVGAELIQPYAGIPRSLLVRGNARQFLRAVNYFLLRRKGFGDYCAFHMDGRQLQGFTPQGWRQTYRRIAEFLKLNVNIRGVFGSAWFYDPAVAEISPHLAYLREVREAGGARNFCYGVSAGVTSNALAKSRRRNALYREGRYTPRSYYLVWHRRELIDWAEKSADGR